MAANDKLARLPITLFPCNIIEPPWRLNATPIRKIQDV
jgi:hypothetical protein